MPAERESVRKVREIPCLSSDRMARCQYLKPGPNFILSIPTSISQNNRPVKNVDVVAFTRTRTR